MDDDRKIKVDEQGNSPYAFFPSYPLALFRKSLSSFSFLSLSKSIVSYP